ncbi:hypothetical protein HDU97_001302 [Phlyctochytrium planicorne]|nr:hypothetical protein HDU97_001302 [Phlyctochytrium planicorne]
MTIDTDPNMIKDDELILSKPPTSSLASYYEPMLDGGYVPDFVLRRGIRYLLSRRKAQCEFGSLTANNRAKADYIQGLREKSRIAFNTKEANEQHYEVPTEFFRKHLGERMKYSSCFYEDGAKTLEEAEEAMLNLYVERSQVKDGMSILELGCGWGSLCLYLAERFPNSPVTGLSNSNGQREYITSVAEKKGLTNLKIITADINEFNFKNNETFDRILSIEMFEHMKNFASLFSKVSSWLVPTTGRLFVHVFAHKSMPYDFKTSDSNSWMARTFFTGGTMPSEDLFLWFQEHLCVLDRWTVDGRNYGRTSEEWLRRLDLAKKDVMPILAECYGGEKEAAVWFNRWRVFYMSVAELFNYDEGQEWCVVHYLFKRQDHV